MADSVGLTGSRLLAQTSVHHPGRSIDLGSCWSPSRGFNDGWIEQFDGTHRLWMLLRLSARVMPNRWLGALCLCPLLCSAALLPGGCPCSNCLLVASPSVGTDVLPFRQVRLTLVASSVFTGSALSWRDGAPLQRCGSMVWCVLIGNCLAEMGDRLSSHMRCSQRLLARALRMGWPIQQRVFPFLQFPRFGGRGNILFTGARQIHINPRAVWIGRLLEATDNASSLFYDSVGLWWVYVEFDDWSYLHGCTAWLPIRAGYYCRFWITLRRCFVHHLWVQMPLWCIVPEGGWE